MIARPFAFLRRLAAGVLLALPLACLQIGSTVEPSRTESAVAGMVLECPVGAEGCPCTPGGGCDPGLTCVSGYCSYSYDYEQSDEATVYHFDDDLALESPAPAPPVREERAAARPSRGDKLDSKRKERGRFTHRSVPVGDSVAMPNGATSPTTAVTIDVTGSNPPEEPATGPALEDLGRQVIYTASLYVAVFGLDAAIEFAERIPERYGGWIESRYNYQITLRVPAEHLFTIIEQLSELGVVLDKTLQADDVTAEYVDLESRILILEQIVAHLELLLKQATTVEQALEIRVELDRMRIELEAARARMRQLAEMIDFSTLTLVLSERGTEAPAVGNDPFPWVDSLGTEATEYR